MFSFPRSDILRVGEAEHMKLFYFISMNRGYLRNSQQVVTTSEEKQTNIRIDEMDLLSRQTMNTLKTLPFEQSVKMTVLETTSLKTCTHSHRHFAGNSPHTTRHYVEVSDLLYLGHSRRPQYLANTRRLQDDCSQLG